MRPAGSKVMIAGRSLLTLCRFFSRISAMATTKRGRPPKFGRPSRLVALTLPEDVLSSLRQVDPDPARAVVKLVETSGEKTNGRQDDSKPVAELVTVGSRRSLIVVAPGGRSRRGRLRYPDQIPRPGCPAVRMLA